MPVPLIYTIFHSPEGRASASCTRGRGFEPVTVHAPYLASSKADILRDGLAMGLDYRHTWTCYEGQQLACGQCGSCRERLAAFAANHSVDPLDYAIDTSQVAH